MTTSSSNAVGYDASVEDHTAASPSDRATLLVIVGSATLAFMLGFNVGAFGVIFFDQLLLVWVIATIVLVASIISDLPPNTWPRRLILLLPSLWLLSAWVDNAQDVSQGERMVFFLTLAVLTAYTLNSGLGLVRHSGGQDRRRHRRGQRAERAVRRRRGCRDR